LKVPKDLEELEVEAFFSGLVNKNGCKYMQCGDPELIARIKNLWMVLDKKTWQASSCLIPIAMAMGIICKKKGNHVINWALFATWMRRLLMKRSFLGLEQEGHNLDEEEGNLDVEGELVDDIKVVAPIQLEPTMNINQLLEYYILIQSQLLEVECELNKLLKMQLEVTKDLMCHKTQLDDKQYHLWVAKNSCQDCYYTFKI
jgi:hypothetical protein